MTDNANLLPAFDLQGYDMVVGITQETINYQLKELWKKGIVHKTLAFDARAESTVKHIKQAVSVSLHASLDHPTVEILEGSDNRRKLLFHLKMTSGSLTSSSFDAPLNFSNWEYVFTVDLDMQEIAHQAVQNHTLIPQEVKDHLNNFTDDMFTIRHLFMDFQDADLATYDKSRSRCPLPGDWGGGDLAQKPGDFTLSLVQTALEGHFKSLAGDANPYILGYAVESKQASGVNLLPTLDPTSSTFSTNYNNTNQALSSLNFLVMTDNRPLPTDPKAGLFAQPTVPATGSDGRILVARTGILDGWLLEKLRQVWSEEIQPDEWYNTGMEGQSTDSSQGGSPNRGAWAYQPGAAPLWIFSYDVRYHWTYIQGWHCLTEHSNIYKQQQDTRGLDLILLNPSASTTQVYMLGSYYVRQDWNFDCTGTPGHTWAWVKQPISARLVISGGQNGQLGQQFTLTPANADSDDGASGWASKWIGGDDYGARGKNMSAFLASITNVDTDFTSSMNSAAARFVLPAGEVFFFKNPQFDQAGNLLLDVTYKM
jgi:hypothetical protein